MSLHVCVCAWAHTHTQTRSTKYREIWSGETESRKEIQRKMEKHNKHSNVFPLKFMHVYLLQLKKLKTGRRGGTFGSRTEKTQVVGEG